MRSTCATGQNNYSDQSNAQAEVVAGGVGEVLFDAEVAFGRLNGSMSERNLDLFEGGVTFVGEFGKGATQVMGGDLDPDPPAILLDNLEHGLRGHAGADDAVAFVDGAQQPALLNPGRAHPLINGELGPGRHRHGADALAFADQVDQYPAGVSQLDVFDREQRQLLAAQAAANETEQRPVAFSLVGDTIRQGEHLFGLAQRQPVAGPGAMTLGALDAADGRGELGREDPVIGRLIGEFANRAQPDVDGRGRQALLLESQTVALDGPLSKTFGRVRGGPDVEVIESLAVGAAGVGRSQTVEDEGFEAVPGSDC